MYNPLSIWKKYCSAELKGYGINTGHYLAEEDPEEIIKCVRRFFNINNFKDLNLG